MNILESLKNKEVLLIGGDLMAINQILVSQGMNLKFIVVGRREQSAQSFREGNEK